jgi:uncharacterized protein (DUF1786 family)
MKILTVDIGTGTQDIFLYDTNLDLENGFKMVLPSPTMMIYRKIKAATARGRIVLLTGTTMGGGPATWAAEAHARAGLPIYATPTAALSFNDELSQVEKMGIKIIPEDKVFSLPSPVLKLELMDFDYTLIARTFAAFQVPLDDLAAVCVAVFDHGNAPPGISDRQYRFDYLDECILNRNALSSFAFPYGIIPTAMTRLRAVAHSANNLPFPILVMDTAPAAILGASLDPVCAARPRKLIVNVGNFHTIAFRLGPAGIEGIFEHHTGEIERPKLEGYLRALADGSLQNSTVFNDMGHGARIYDSKPLELGTGDWDVIVSGPRRSMFGPGTTGDLRPYFATPFGDMMLAGNFGLLAAAADLMDSELADPLRERLSGLNPSQHAPWDVEY